MKRRTSNKVGEGGQGAETGGENVELFRQGHDGFDASGNDEG